MMQRRLSELYHGPETAGGTRLGDMGKPTLISEAMDAGRAYLPTLGQIGQFIYDMTPPGALEAYAQDRAAGAYGPALLAILPGGVAAKKGVKAAGKVASRRRNMYNFPSLEQRPFDADYPNWISENAGQKLTRDIEGRSLDARRIAGRRMVGRKDEAVAADDALAKATTGRVSENLPRSGEHLQGNDGGLFVDFEEGYDGAPTGQVGIGIADDLESDDAAMVLAHELAHRVDMLTGSPRSRREFKDRKWGIKPKLGDDDYLIEEQLYRVYRDGNNQHAKHWGPKDDGYKEVEVNKELWAEAIRTYMANPNYLKSVAPDVAREIRAAVNPNPKLNKIIQFNSNAGIGVLGAGALGAGAVQASDGDDESLGAILTRAMEGR